jgi:hypothetical protein
MNVSRLSSLTFSAAVAAFITVAAAQAAPDARVEIPDAAQPQLAIDSKGRVWLAYGWTATAAAAPAHKDGAHGKGGGHAHGGPRPVGDLFVARSDDGGATFTSPTKVASVPNLMLGNRRGPRLAVQGDRLTVTVIGAELLAFTSTNAGKTWSDGITVNEVPTSAREGLHDLAASSEGELFVTWLDLRNGAMELWGASSRDGRTWTKNQQVYRSPAKSICECCHPSALYDDGGNLAVMWRNSIEGSRDMWMATRAKGAAQFSAPRKLGEGTWKLNACPMDGGRLLALGDGKFGAIWQRNGDVFLSRAGADEIPLGKGKQPVAIQSSKGSPIAVWQQGADLVFLRGVQGAAPSKMASDARFPVIVPHPGGKGALIAYERGPRGATSIIVERR